MDKSTQILIGIGAFFGLTTLGNGLFDTGTQSADAPAKTPTPRPGDAHAATSSSSGQFSTTRAPDGHFYADAHINGRPVRMLIDTGASSVVLNRQDAAAAGIAINKNGFTQRANTAGGTISIMPVRLDSVRVGTLQRSNIEGFVADSDLGISLIGQSFLERVDTVEIERNVIRLR